MSIKLITKIYHLVVNFLEKYDTLYGLLKDLLTRRMTFKGKIDAQINFINDLTKGYNELDFDKELPADLNKNKFASSSLSLTNLILKKPEDSPNKEIQSFFPKNVKVLISNKEKKCFIKFNESI